MPRIFLHALLAVGGAAALSVAAAAATVSAEEPQPETFAVLTTEKASYTNVVVVQKTKTDLFIRHAQGIASLKVEHLDKSTQLQLGYSLEPLPRLNSGSTATTTTNRANTNRTNLHRVERPKTLAGHELTVPSVPFGPRLEELWEKAVWESKEALAALAPQLIHGVLGGLVLLYLLFCNSCRLLCRRTGRPANFLIWFPVLKQFPLLKAAGMSRWWFLAHFVPLLPLVAYILWCFKITRARDKTALTAWLLLLPFTNVFAFLYLAHSRGEGDDAAGADDLPKPISLSFESKRDAA